MAAAVSAVVAALIATIFERIFITILAASLAVVLAFFVFTDLCPEAIEAARDVPINAGQVTSQSASISVRQTPEVIKAYIADFYARAKQAALHMPAYGWAIMATLAVVLLVTGFYLQWLTSALCCATLGTLLTFAGMILLLLYKGSVPISIICKKPLYYSVVFGVMVVFGAVVQLVLCPKLGRKTRGKKG